MDADAVKTAPPERALLVVGAATPASLRARMPLLAARAHAAAACGKSLPAFVRESGRDWVDAPCRLVVIATSLADLEEKLGLAEAHLAGADALRPSAELEARGIHLGFPGIPATETGPALPPGLAGTSGPSPAPLAPGSLGPSLAPPAPGAPGPSPALPPAEPAGAPRRRVRETVLAVAAERTGYAVGALGPDLDLQEELGIDSLKHAEVIETLWDRYGLPRDETLLVVDYPTLGHMIRHLEAVVPPDAAEAGAAGGFAPAPKAPPGPEMGSTPEPRPGPEMGCAPEPPPGPAGRSTPAEGCAPAPEPRPGPAEGAGVDLAFLRAFWRTALGNEDIGVTHVTEALIRKFVREIRIEDPAGLAALRGGPAIFLSNHQTAVEMYTFPLIAAALGGRVIEGVAMRDHGVDWADPMRDFLTSHGDIPRSQVAPARAIDTADPREVLRVLPELEADLRTGGRSLLIAAQGMRERTARAVMRTVSSVWIDLALSVGAPLVPVRFRGGLPVDDPGVTQDLPLGLGSQTFLVGPPIRPADLQPLSPPERRARVLEALNRLGPPETEEPHPPDREFAREVGEWLAYSGGPDILGVLLCALVRSRPLPGFEVREGPHVLPCATDALVAAGRLGLALRRPVALALPDTNDGRWVAMLARMTFGSGGPQVCERLPFPEGCAATVTVGEVEAERGR